MNLYTNLQWTIVGPAFGGLNALATLMNLYTNLQWTIVGPAFGGLNALATLMNLSRGAAYDGTPISGQKRK